MNPLLSRRRFVTGVTTGSVLLPAISSYAASRQEKKQPEPPVLRGTHFDLTIGYQNVNFTGRDRLATTVNNSLPAPVLRWREGDTVTLNVKNTLAHDSSIHWHGLILPTEMDGVPHLSFPGIKPGETFRYQFKVQQSGTYWYHSHSGYQEQTGIYGAIVIDPEKPEPRAYDREFVILMSDWSDEAPEKVYAKLKKMSHYYNFNERTAGDLFSDIKNKGVKNTWKERAMWNSMRMSDSDIADVTGYTYTYLMNGITPADGWTGLFKNGEKILLRFINGSAMTIFDVRIPGLKMKVVAADGQAIEPVTVDEFRIAVAETYDVLVEPESDTAYTVFAQNIDRSGYARGILTPDVSLHAEIPDMDYAPILSHQDMGMAHAHENHAAMNRAEAVGEASACTPEHAAMGHCSMEAQTGETPAIEIRHLPTEFGAHVDMQAEAPQSGLHDPGIGLRDHMQRYGRKVLTYADLKNRFTTLDTREPGREIQLHLTGNMRRYMWSINGINFADAEPLMLNYGERVRIVLVNDTMMTHPIHLHGMWSELECGDVKYLPRKHTVIVQPGSTISYQVTADAVGRWAYHCHLMYHMAGMMREVRVV